ncbi:hypothetical protein [Pararhodobacter sp. CCB-MM2]|uniref:hypothetical protein n=1 Tax=Pararhodobacter sp. CCB-MM2 TaxID=1786003 RepID=UPI00082EF757|nr:hypothetical protein [Pararhodobacter sp. CCB-MM2]
MSAIDSWQPPLDRDETLLWRDRPQTGLGWRDFINGQALFGLFFTAFSCVWFLGARAMTSGDGAFGLFPYFVTPFFLVGLYMVIGRPFHADYQRRHTTYALTDRAAFIARLSMGQVKVQRLPFAEMNVLELEDDSPGTVWFRREEHIRTYRTRSRNGISHRRRQRVVVAIGFERIGTARQVYRLIADHTRSETKA